MLLVTDSFFRLTVTNEDRIVLYEHELSIISRVESLESDLIECTSRTIIASKKSSKHNLKR